MRRGNRCRGETPWRRLRQPLARFSRYCATAAVPVAVARRTHRAAYTCALRGGGLLLLVIVIGIAVAAAFPLGRMMVAGRMMRRGRVARHW